MRYPSDDRYIHFASNLRVAYAICGEPYPNATMYPYVVTCPKCLKMLKRVKAIKSN